MTRFDAFDRGGNSRPFRARPLAAVALLALAAACTPGPRTAQQTLLDYTEAVQEEDLQALYCLSAGAASATELGADETQRRAGFERWARQWYESYLQGRDSGRVEFGEHGIVLVKLFALGRGTYYSITGIRSLGTDGLEVETRLRFGYRGMDLSRLSPGTTFYLCGVPPGRVHPIVVRPNREESVEVLDTLTLRWILSREPETEGCPERWAVASVDPVEGSESTEQITWVF